MRETALATWLLLWWQLCADTLNASISWQQSQRWTWMWCTTRPQGEWEILLGSFSCQLSTGKCRWDISQKIEQVTCCRSDSLYLRLRFSPGQLAQMEQGLEEARQRRRWQFCEKQENFCTHKKIYMGRFSKKSTPYCPGWLPRLPGRKDKCARYFFLTVARCLFRATGPWTRIRYYLVRKVLIISVHYEWTLSPDKMPRKCVSVAKEGAYSGYP